MPRWLLRARRETSRPSTETDGKAREAAAFDSARSGKSEIFVDNRDLLRRPSEFGCAGSKGILTLGQFAVVFDLLDSDASNRAAASRRLAAQGSREASS
jgi:hypothetical protein